MTEIDRTLCETCTYQECYPAQKPCLLCVCGVPLRITGNYYSKYTNSDYIRRMSDKQLARWLCDVQDDIAEYRDFTPTMPLNYDEWLEWLTKEKDNG